jgi:hypothetical protein
MANGTILGLSTSSAIVNGQLVPQARSQLYYPSAVGPIIQGVPSSPPQSSVSGVSGASSDAASLAAQNPWSPTQSPVPWLIGMFVVGYLMLKYVHWGY